MFNHQRTIENKPKIICLFGNSRCAPGDEEYHQAEQLGRLIAQAGMIVCTGGYEGIMEAASRTAQAAGGQTIGITSDIFSSPPNPYLTREIREPDLFSRLKSIADMGDAFIALRGGMGTLTEVTLMWNLLVLGCLNPPKPFVLVGACWRPVVASWSSHLAVDGRDLPHVMLVDSAEQAIDYLHSYWQMNHDLAR
ncbi:MAG: LOG family protein [Acidobacteriota bacterium]|nr:LOG family protein [Blastocatellia bacterium]MDW8240413.1 LOG family protein [Acidobacteriota bacterium]